jgi:hypothetical protein
MLRLYFLQQWFNLSDPAVEGALHDSLKMRRFVGRGAGKLFARRDWHAAVDHPAVAPMVWELVSSVSAQLTASSAAAVSGTGDKEGAARAIDRDVDEALDAYDHRAITVSGVVVTEEMQCKVSFGTKLLKISVA